MIKPTKIWSAVSNKRELLARTLGHLGVLSLLEHAAAARNPGLTVLTYHRITAPESNPFYDPVISATPDAFLAQIIWISKHTRTLTLEELVGRVQEGALGREPVTFVTFDDGYRDNFDVAVPILSEQNVPATFFIPTEFIENPCLPWWDEVAYTIKRTTVRRFTLECSSEGKALPLEVDLERMSRTTAIRKIIGAVLDRTVNDEQNLLDQLRTRTETVVDRQALGRSLFVSWEELQHMPKLSTRFTIGSHSHSHRNLARLDDGSQRRELIESKQLLQSRTGCEINAFAYPYGWPGTFTASTKAIAAEAGYCVAFASREGVNTSSSFDPLEISRFGVGRADSLALLRGRCALHANFGKSFL